MGFFLNKDKINKKIENWKQDKEILKQQLALKKEKIQFFEQNKILKKKKVSTSKKIILFLFINCSIIELFTGYITIVDLHLAEQTGMVDFTPIVTLIGAVVSEIIGFAIYAAKATKENTKGGVVFENMMNEYHSFENTPEIKQYFTDSEENNTVG